MGSPLCLPLSVQSESPRGLFLEWQHLQGVETACPHVRGVSQTNSVTNRRIGIAQSR